MDPIDNVRPLICPQVIRSRGRHTGVAQIIELRSHRPRRRQWALAAPTVALILSVVLTSVVLIFRG